jgi:signal transduction histidine kinase
MSELINSLLDYSRLSHPTGAFRETDLNEILEKVRTDEELLIQKSGAVIGSDLLPTVRAIALQMEQLFSNLIANAIKFCNKTPKIKISASRQTAPPDKIGPGLDPERPFHVIVFHDNGIGFSAEYNDQIFKPFQRLQSKSEYEGTGIGLSIVSKIAENHGGFVEAASNPGQGSTFSVWLPV